MFKNLHIYVATIFFISLSGPVLAATHNVDQVGNSFSPANITINEGDTVIWFWTGGFHTVTNGFGAADPTAGTLFDATLSSSSTRFEYTFNTPGFYDYFCRPHETLGMVGTVDVRAAVPTPTPSPTNTFIVFDTPTPTPTHTPTTPFTPTPEMTQIPLDTTPALVLVILGLSLGVLVFAGAKLR